VADLEMRTALACAAAMALSLVPGSAYAQAFPSKPVRIVVPAVPGGGTDILARLLSPRLQAILGRRSSGRACSSTTAAVRRR
jgi:tripartite-type tricarboxylate transporter receptor subunit TctC